jgi:hypothetical protein
LILEAKIAELEEAVHHAQKLRQENEAKFWARELLFHLEALYDTFGTDKGTSGTNAGKPPGS